MDDRIAALLVKPQLKAFREQFRIGQTRLEISFEGWHRIAVFADERVFLFPRHQHLVRGILREARVLKILAGKVTLAPVLLGQWRDDAISPYPFIAVTRLSGSPWSTRQRSANVEDLTTMFANLGRAIASWHRIDVRDLPSSFRRSTKHLKDFAAEFEPERLQGNAARAAVALNLSESTVDRWLREIEPLAGLPRVLVHGDLHESQILLNDQLEVTGIVDWEAAGVGHPLKDFDIGEWGLDIFAWEPEFDRFRKAMWGTYTEAIDLPLPPWTAMHRFFCLMQLPIEADSSDWGKRRKQTILRHLQKLELATQI